MNVQNPEGRMIKILKDLKANCGVYGLKASTEDEGLSHTELRIIRDIAKTADLPIALKIGGPAAEADIRFGINEVGVSGVVAPMVESAYGLESFLKLIAVHARGKDVTISVNIETIQACENFSEMLALSNIGLLDSVTIGRVDLIGSLRLSREEINSQQVFGLAKGVYTKAREAGLEANIGGGITPKAIPFIGTLLNMNLLDRFETRNVIFSAGEGMKSLRDGVDRANAVELLWLCVRLKYCPNTAIGDKERIETRIQMMNERRQIEGYDQSLLG